MRKAILTLAAGLAVLAGVGVRTLSQAPPRLVRTAIPGAKAIGPNGLNGLLAGTSASPTICQEEEVLPAGVSAVRVAIWAFYGARVHVIVYKDGKLLTQGSRGGNWTSDSVTVPLTPLRHTVSGAKTCVAIGPNSEPLTVIGPNTQPQIAAVMAEGAPANRLSSSTAPRLQGRMTLEYLAPGRVSWWSRLLSVARHLGLGRAYAGSWIALLIAALMAAVGVLVVRLTLRELR